MTQKQLEVLAMAMVLAVLHASLPNHWIPFVLVGRALRWSRARTLAILALAGGAHVVVTSALGVAVCLFGATLLENFHEIGEKIAGALLIALGALYVAVHLFGRGHHHTHAAAGAIYADEHDAPAHSHETHEEHQKHAGRARARAVSERGAIATLLVGLTFSPCGAVVLGGVVGIEFGMQGVIAAAVLVSLTTVAVMFALTWLTLMGVERLEAPWLDSHEMLLTGSILAAIGVAVLVLQ